jgi:hypothetical protein
MASPEEILKKILILGVDEIPEVGAIIGFFIDVLWPEVKETGLTWDEIREKTEKLIHQQLDADTKARLEQTLVGLGKVISDYHDAVDEGNAASIQDYYVAARVDFDQNIPAFQQKSHELLLLPMFVQAANLQLILLRDAVLHGDKMNMSATMVDQQSNALSKNIAEYSKYISKTYQAGRKSMHVAEGEYRNDFVLHLTVAVLDYLEIWKRMDPSSQPTPGPILTREVFSSPNGQRGYGDKELPQSPPQKGYYRAPPEDERVTMIRLGWTDTSAGVSCLAVHYDGGFNSGWMGQEKRVRHALDIPIDPKRSLRGIGMKTYGEFTMPDSVHYLDEDAPQVGTYYPVPAGHYLSSVNVKSKFNDYDRGWLYNDLVRLFWMGFRYDPELDKSQPPGPSSA